VQLLTDAIQYLLKDLGLVVSASPEHPAGVLNLALPFSGQSPYVVHDHLGSEVAMSAIKHQIAVILDGRP
jgi:hypothetical protein